MSISSGVLWEAGPLWPRGRPRGGHAQTVRPRDLPPGRVGALSGHRCARCHPWVPRSRAALPTVRPTGDRRSRGATHRPGGRLGCARLLEGHLEVVRAGVVGVGGDDRRGRHGVEGGAGLRVGRVGGHVGASGVLRGVGAARGRAAAHLVHGVAQQMELGLAGRGGGTGETHSQAGE